MAHSGAMSAYGFLVDEVNSGPGWAGGGEATVEGAVRPALRSITREEVARHASTDDCWVIIHGKVYDVTRFARTHVGGPGPLYACKGKDATKFFSTRHHENVLDSLPAGVMIGRLADDAPPAAPRARL
eukprot:TRINITY_DN49937_c0_g1_i1.p2 TRINITY_DN49937_c0_g1~~TRINITY_DN49937_c0_g1_i1.p2  ORF type:complete len:150 (+),score=31.28 TRINITY_DN49937_c0_g1_i1:69-452(+)